jgi:ribonuclease III
MSLSERARERLQQVLEYEFVDPTLLEHALTHRSVGNRHNERLEFLGDSVLSFVVTTYLYATYDRLSEAQLTLMRSQLVKRDTLARLASSIDLGDALRFSAAVSGTGVQRRSSVLADGLEAVIGAVFLDGGAEAVREVVMRLLASELASLDPRTLKDAKTKLQENLQARGLGLPRYEVIGTEGAEHVRVYEVRCETTEGLATTGQGASRRAAEQDAAARLLILMQSSTTHHV